MDGNAAAYIQKGKDDHIVHVYYEKQTWPIKNDNGRNCRGPEVVQVVKAL